MRNDSKIIALLWTVIIVLVLGGAVGGYMLLRHANDVDTANSQLTGDNDSLRRQLKEAKTTPTPTVAPLPTPNQPTPAPTSAAKATIAPKATIKP
ncbi:MAG: hypothetical protein NVSMB39_6670 [Candidatus Saccharimonadales bacterium]